MTIVEELFQGTNAVSTRAVAAALEISEADARAWADQLNVAKIGASFAWTRDEVDALVAELEEDDEEEEDGPRDGADGDDEDDEEDDEEDEDEDDEGDDE